MISIGLLALGGLFAGGAYSLYKQGSSKVAIAVVAVVAVLAIAGGVLWLLPQKG